MSTVIASSGPGFKGGELAVEKRGWHVVAGAGSHARRDQLAAAGEVDEGDGAACT